VVAVNYSGYVKGIGKNVSNIRAYIARFWAWVIIICTIAGPAFAQTSGTITWEDEAFNEGQAIPRNFVVNSGGVQATLTYDTITDGGTQVPAGGFPDFLSYFDQFTFSGEDGIALIAYDNSFNDRDDRIIINLGFNQPVLGLNFDLLNFTQSATVDDAVQVFFDDGVGPQQILLNNPAFFTEGGPAIIPDNIPGVTDRSLCR